MRNLFSEIVNEKGEKFYVFNFCIRCKDEDKAYELDHDLKELLSNYGVVSVFK